MKILFVFTGGTIGSTVKGDYISTDEGKPYILLEEYDKKYGLSFEYDSAEPYTELSENNCGEMIGRLIDTVKERTENGGYDGVIVTHGTDTIQYSAAALAYTLNAKVPIMILSANRPVEDPLSNGLANMRAAVEFIANVRTPGVWVPYQNEPDGNIYVHFAARLLGSMAFSDKIFSVCDMYYGYFDSGYGFCRNESAELVADEISPLGHGDLAAAAERILFIEPYPGMTYPDIDGIDYIVHKSYHSGTINTKNYCPKDFFEKAAQNGTAIFLVGVYDGQAYESTGAFGRFSIIPIKHIAPIAAYVKLWLCVSEGKDPAGLLGRSLGSDIIPFVL